MTAYKTEQALSKEAQAIIRFVRQIEMPADEFYEMYSGVFDRWARLSKRSAVPLIPTVGFDGMYLVTGVIKATDFPASKAKHDCLISACDILPYFSN